MPTISRGERWIWKVNRGIWEDFREIKLSYVVEVWGGGGDRVSENQINRDPNSKKGKTLIHSLTNGVFQPNLWAYFNIKLFLTVTKINVA